MGDEAKTGGVQSILEKYVTPRASRPELATAAPSPAEDAVPEDGAEPVVEAEGGAYSHSSSTRRFEQPKLEFRFLTGRKKSLSYGFIDAVEIDGGTLIIEHTRYRAVLKGRNLDALYDHVKRERVGFIQQTNPMKDTSGDDAAAVYEMVIEPW